MSLDFLKNEIEDLKRRNIFGLPRILEGEQTPRCTINGKEVINLSSNNYLGLTNHPHVKAAAVEAANRWGAGAGAVPSIIGTMSVHRKLEEKIAKFKKTEAALVFQSGFAANLGTIPVLVGEEDLVISDELNHASIIDGVRLSKANKKIYKHKDMDDLKRVLEESKGFPRIMIITDGVFSMDGDIAPLDKIAQIAKQYGAITYVDDAHATGVLGKNGRGTVDHFNLHGKWDVQMGTLSKAIGVMGGYIAGDQALKEILINRARTYLFSTNHPPSTAAACIAAIEVLETDEARIKRLWDNTKFFKDRLKRAGFNIGVSETPITPVIVGKSAVAQEFTKRLFDSGLFALAIYYPMVSEEKSRLRTIVTSEHSREDLDDAVKILETVGKELKII